MPQTGSLIRCTRNLSELSHLCDQVTFSAKLNSSPLTATVSMVTASSKPSKATKNNHRDKMPTQIAASQLFPKE